MNFIENISWDFGDNNFSTQNNPSHTYSKAGNFNVSLIVANSFGADTTVQTITIDSLGVNFTVDSILHAGSSVYFYENLFGVVDFSWNFGDGNYDSISNPIHIYETKGTYNVTLSAENANGCYKTITKTINISFPLSSENEIKFDNFSIYPNPNTGNFYIEINSNLSSDIQLKIYDALGKVISNETISKQENKYIKKMNFEKILPGIYFIEYFNGNVLKTEKLIIQ